MKELCFSMYLYYLYDSVDCKNDILGEKNCHVERMVQKKISRLGAGPFISKTIF